MNEETLFEAALSRSPDDRAAFLDEACAGRPELRAAVLALLAAHEKADNVLDRPPAHALESGAGEAQVDATGVDTPGPDEARLPAIKTADCQPMFEAGVVIGGHYTLQQRIGEGGMGEVWVAKQTEPVKRKVALKLIKTGMDSKAVVQRFEQERQALALMDHPNIAKVLDGGLTPRGQPFFVMELVNGLPLTKFCDEARLTTKERLELFVSICQAVQHAHQKGIVHRDLKPANILVTMIDAKPVARVIDFGVAKATADKLTDVSMSTQFGAVIGTLEYMSPEQAGYSGEDIDTRSDVYSLGVILYELLTGLRPIDARRLSKAALTEMIRIIREEEPSKPSTRLSTDESLPSMAALRQTDPRTLTALLRGELDWVVMKCLEKHRERRYETADGLARDIQRYLANEAVEARPPSAGYRFGKFLKRHKGPVIAASLVLLAVAGGLLAVAAVQTVANAQLSAALARETRANTALATANADLARSHAAVQARYELATEAIKTFHTGVSEDFLLKEEQFKDLRNRLLKSASDFYGKLEALLGKETNFASRRALAQTNFELAELTDKVGRKEHALATHRQVLAVREGLAAEPGADIESKVEVGRSLAGVALELYLTGKTEEAWAAYGKAETLLADLVGSSPTTQAARAALAACRSRNCVLLIDKGKSAEALAKARLARADREALAAVPGASNEARYELVGSIQRIAEMLFNTGNYPESEAEIRTALTLSRKLADAEPAATLVQAQLAGLHDLLAAVLLVSGKMVEAEPEFRKGLLIIQKVSDANPAVTEFQRRLHDHLESFSDFLRDAGKLTDAEAALRKALAVARKLADDNPDAPEFRLSLLPLNHARVLLDMGREAEAEAEFRAGTSIMQKLVHDHPGHTRFPGSLAEACSYFGEFLSVTGKPSEAEPVLRQGLAILEKLPALDQVVMYSHARLESLSNLGSALRQLGRLAEARETLDRAVHLAESKVKENRYFAATLGHALLQRGLNRIALGEDARAAADARRGASAFEEAPERWGTIYFLSSCCHAQLAGLAGKAGSGVPAAEGPAEADKAMVLLRKAFDLGFRNSQYRTEPSLGPFRRREDFEKLLAELEPKSAARPK
jgi:serine/threonine protein kinase/tetratricopeptide (TPR) repeat protein